MNLTGYTDTHTHTHTHVQGEMFRSIQMSEFSSFYSEILIPFNGIDGIKFYMTSPATGDRNKGRICIDDIVLSLDPNDTDFISGNYEAII